MVLVICEGSGLVLRVGIGLCLDLNLRLSLNVISDGSR
jgi:hypothetical protein